MFGNYLKNSSVKVIYESRAHICVGMHWRNNCLD